MNPMHTPGPWKITANGDSIYRIEGAVCEFVCCVSHNNMERHRPQRTPNARLIAAAPEMLSALEDLTAQLWHDGPRDGSEEAWKRIKSNALAAIRKAKGEL